jgi:hypothetical protein
MCNVVSPYLSSKGGLENLQRNATRKGSRRRCGYGIVEDANGVL